MTNESLPPGLWQETRQRVEAWGQTRGRHEEKPRPIATGQVLVLPELGEPRLAWAVLRQDKNESGPMLLVAADVNPLVGSGDVATTAITGPVASPLTLRCRFIVWVREREMGAATLLGTLSPEGLERADSRWQALSAGGLASTFSEQETEEDPEYQDWIEDVVRPAVSKLEARAGTDAPEALPVLPFSSQPRDKPLPVQRGDRGDWLRWAAVLALVLLGAGGGFLGWRQAREITGLRAATEAREAAHRQAIADLEAHRAKLESDYQEKLRKAGQDRARLDSEHRARLQELEEKIGKLRQATEVRNPLVADLESPGTRGATRLVVGPEVSHLVLQIPVDDPAETEFTAEVLEKHSGQRVWIQKGLRTYVIGEVRLGIPTALLPPGDYRLILYRRENGKLLQVRDHMITIDEEPRQRPLRF